MARVQCDSWHARNRALRQRCLFEGVCVCVMPALMMVVLVGGAWSSRLDAVWLFTTTFGMFVAGLLGAGMGLRPEIHRREQAL